LFFGIHLIILAFKMNKVLDGKMAEQTRFCEICGVSFVPDPRVGDRQKVCFTTSCQQERKRRSQAAWLSRNQGYFKGRYTNTKVWLEAHPGYLQAYRQRHKANGRADIQDELRFVKSIPASELRDIQDELTACFEKHLGDGDSSVRADIQDELRLFISMLYLAMIYKTRWRL
jgi:hypothetical protein